MKVLSIVALLALERVSRSRENGERPPKAMVEAAKEGLRRHKQFGGGLTKEQAQAQGINSGVERAKQIIRGGPFSDDDLRSMRNFFNRHRGYKPYHSRPKSRSKTSWLLWGSDPGEAWVKRQMAARGLM